MEGQPLVWAAVEALPDFPMGKVDRQIARRLISESSNGSISG
jgi:hypothetical protein